MILEMQKKLDAPEAKHAALEDEVKTKEARRTKLWDKREVEYEEELKSLSRDMEDEWRAEWNKVEKLEARNKALMVESKYGK